MAVSPMFPLGLTVLPGSLVPLQVFEPRYVEMIRDLLAADGEPVFGSVLIERGHEVGGDDDRNDVGALVHVADLRVTPDGRYLVTGVGGARIRVNEWLPDEPYPRADVDPWPDVAPRATPDEIGARVADATAHAARLIELVRSLGHEVASVDHDLATEPERAVYQLAARTPLGAADRYRVLCAPGLDDRISVLTEAIDDAMAVIEFHRS